jgi:hypothetical protein
VNTDELVLYPENQNQNRKNGRLKNKKRMERLEVEF